MENKCVFCDIARNIKEDYIIWQNADFMLILEISPAKKAHCMLIPKKHISDVFNMVDEEYSQLMTYARKASYILQKYSQAVRVGLAIVGMSVDHAHVHLVPLHASNELFDPAKFRRASKEELVQVHSQLKKSFENFK